MSEVAGFDQTWSPQSTDSALLKGNLFMLHAKNQGLASKVIDPVF